MTAFLHFNKILQIPIIIYHHLTGQDYKTIINFFVNEKNEDRAAKKKNILELRKINNLELKENVYLKSPENIQKLANKFLDKDYIFFKNEDIEFLVIDEKK